MNSRAGTVKQLKTAVWMYLILGFLIAGLNVGLKPMLGILQGERITLIYELFETIGRTAFVLYGGILMFKLYSKRHIYRRKSIAGFMVMMSLLFVLLPVMTGYYEFVYAFMPFPWSTYPLQLLYDGHFLHSNVGAAFGGRGAEVMLTVYVAFQVLVYGAVAIKGRRIFCSMICPYGGCHAETFSEALPLVLHFDKGRDKVNQTLKLFLLTLKMFLITANMLLILLWIIALAGASFINVDILRTFELVKYLSLELMLFLALYLFLNGRGYCYYCPAGTMLSFWGLLFGHGIETNHSECVSCASCNKQCEMNINIMKSAQKGRKIQSSLCVECGHCIDACPTKTLQLKGYRKEHDQVKNED
ncbi:MULTISPECIES: 4Fe-4S binding protein [unclassified Fusibacter]|uniref:4Fe-4S binding protein n=1 Tax=unclassified Fusibacter TaxID=2624464 RepID=UPI001011A8D6|nr:MULTISPECIES: 4Fe-4S dicluster domain-containing protein [unclassified Fusibacter]MCK8061238.1 4Fe-4S binding protein [Fusibacter sp. A2]NPE23418.1 4Fe-4S binding protein [Fusibacter sp. A1]RXV59197.1 hypothetical protein DWB64_16505 [Fusibacter sp. A1]